jgi:hypothetical protein
MKNFTEATETENTPSAGDAERSYRQALKLERDRERKRRRYRKGEFASSMLHIEHDFDFQRIETRAFRSAGVITPSLTCLSR